jgi:hypothetical protein
MAVGGGCDGAHQGSRRQRAPRTREAPRFAARILAAQMRHSIQLSRPITLRTSVALHGEVSGPTGPSFCRRRRYNRLPVATRLSKGATWPIPVTL